MLTSQLFSDNADHQNAASSDVTIGESQYFPEAVELIQIRTQNKWPRNRSLRGTIF